MLPSPVPHVAIRISSSPLRNCRGRQSRSGGWTGHRHTNGRNLFSCGTCAYRPFALSWLCAFHPSRWEQRLRGCAESSRPCADVRQPHCLCRMWLEAIGCCRCTIHQAFLFPVCSSCPRAYPIKPPGQHGLGRVWFSVWCLPCSACGQSLHPCRERHRGIRQAPCSDVFLSGLRF